MTRILLIDDDALARDMLRQMLERAGYDVVEAASGREGLQQYQATSGRYGSPCSGWSCLRLSANWCHSTMGRLRYSTAPRRASTPIHMPCSLGILTSSQSA